MTSSFNWTSTFGSSQDPGIERRDRETLEREKELQRLIEAEKEEEQILTDNAERIRQKDLEENPPLENLESRNLETKPEHWLLRSLGWVGDRMDDVDRAAGIGEFNVYNARQKVLKPLSETHVALGILGEFFVPDTFDIATLGLAYIPKRFAKIPKVWAKLTKAMNGDAARAILKGDDMIVDSRSIAKQYGLTMTDGTYNFLPNFGPDELLSIHEDLLNTTTRYGTRIVQEAPIAQRILFNAPTRTSGGMRGSKLVMKDFKNYWAGNSSKSRAVLEAYMTRPNQYVPGFFERQKDFLKPAFLDEYGEYLENTLNIPPEEIGKSINLHHITPIKASAPLYEGTTYGDEAWFAVTDTFNRHGLFPGAPMTERGVTSVASDIATESNFMYALKEPHDLLHDEFLAETIGKQGQKFFTPSRKRLIKSGKEGRIMVANEYALHIKKGEDFIREAMRQMDALFSNSGVSPEELAEILHKATNKGELKILDTDLFLKSVNDQLKDIAKEASWEEFGTAYGDEVPEVLQKHINKALQSFFQRVQKQYGLSGKGGYGKPPVNPYK